MGKIYRLVATPKQNISHALSLICNLSTKQWRIISTDLRKETVLLMFGKIKGNSSTCLLHYPIHVYRWMYVFSAVSLQKLYAKCNDRTAQQFILIQIHDDVIKKWKHFRVTGTLWGNSPMTPYKGQWRGALMFSLICDWIYGWANNREAGDLRHHRAHYDVIIM